jgi:hypothetical protein
MLRPGFSWNYLLPKMPDTYHPFVVPGCETTHKLTRELLGTLHDAPPPSLRYTDREVYWGANFAHTHSLLSRKGTSSFLLVATITEATR